MKIRLAVLNHPVVVNGFMGATSIDCRAAGGHPTGQIAEICAAAANACPGGKPETFTKTVRVKASAGGR